MRINVCRLQEVEEEFKALRERKQEIYRTWGLGSRNDVREYLLFPDHTS